jgi:hypothetical protein
LPAGEPPPSTPGASPEEVVDALVTKGLFAGMQKREER